MRHSQTEWQVFFLPRWHLAAKPRLPGATSSLHGGGSKTSPCLQRCDSWVSRAPCCCSGNSKGGCWGFRVLWDERKTAPHTLGQWWGAASHENLGQFCLSNFFQKSSGKKGFGSCCRDALFFFFFIKVVYFLLFFFLIKGLMFIMWVKTTCLWSPFTPNLCAISLPCNLMNWIEFCFFRATFFLFSIIHKHIKVAGSRLQNRWAIYICVYTDCKI